MLRHWFSSLLLLQLVYCICSKEVGVSKAYSQPVTYQHNVSPQLVLSPESGPWYPINVSIPLIVRCLNSGSQDEKDVAIVISIAKKLEQPIFRDTLRVKNWKHGEAIDTFFREFTPLAISVYTIKIVTLLESDENTYDDTLTSRLVTTLESDVTAVSVLNPKSNGEIIRGRVFKLQGTFESVGALDIFDVPARVEIRNCENHHLVYRADSAIPALLSDEPPVAFFFPVNQGKYGIASLQEGCYEVAMIVRLTTDGNRRNDTAFSTFKVLPYVYPNDLGIAALSPLDPRKMFKIGEGVSIRSMVSNVGSNNQNDIKVFAEVKDRRGKRVYFETAIIASLLKGDSIGVSFKNFHAEEPGAYTVFFYVISGSDGYPYNDSVTISFAVGPAKDVQVTQILDPHNDEVKPIESEFEPRAVFRFSGISDKIEKVPVRVEIIRLPDSAMAFHVDGAIEELTYYAGLTEFSFPNQIPDTSIRNLPPGHYQMKVMALVPIDDVPANDTAKVDFYIKAYDDIAGDSILLPSNRSNYEYSPIPIKARFANVGFIEESAATVVALVLDTVGAIVYQDTLHPVNWKAGQALDLRFKDFYPLTKGFYTLYCISILEKDYYHKGDTLKNQFFYGLPSLDVKAVAVLEPKPDTTLPSYTYFIPQGVFQWNGGYSDTVLDSFSARIELVQSDSIAFEASGSSFDLRKGEGEVAVWIYHTQPPYTSVDRLEDGYYRLVLIANASDDEDRSNDTVISYFWIGDKASVKAAPLEPLFILDQNYPNPFADKTTISYNLLKEGYVGLRVYDITGRVVMNYPKGLQREGSHSVILGFNDLPHGFYTYEINVTTLLGTSYKLHRQLLHY